MVHTVVVFVKLKTKVKIVKAKTFVFLRSCIRVVHTDVVFVKLKVKVLKVLKPLSLYEAVLGLCTLMGWWWRSLKPGLLM